MRHLINIFKTTKTITAKRGLFSPMQTSMLIKWGNKLKFFFMNQYSLYVGIGAGICTAVSMLPQLAKIIKTRKAEDLSYGMVIILLSGIAGWIWYGILKNDLPIVLTNSFSLVINLLVLFFSIRYKK